MTRLSVNVNKIAVLRNSRGGGEPDVVRAAAACLEAGAHGITVHPRPDQRHIRADDVLALAGLTARHHVELNIEGNPFAPPRPGYPGLLALCEQVRPAQVTLVPDDDGQLTSDHGFDFEHHDQALADLIAAFNALGARVSLFVDAGVAGLERARAMGAARIEIYTGPFAAEAAAQPRQADALARCVQTARDAMDAGLAVNAGHDLAQSNLGLFLATVPAVEEVSIGHALIGEALHAGLGDTVRAYLDIISRVHRPA